MKKLAGGAIAASVLVFAQTAAAAPALHFVVRGTARPSHSIGHVPLPPSIHLARPSEEIDRDRNGSEPKRRSPLRAPVVLSAPGRALLARTRDEVLDPALVGLGLADTPRVTPPDPIVAVGAGFVVELVNVDRRVWTLGGTVLDANSPLSSIFNTGSDSVSDPKIQFDAVTGRWFASVLDISRGAVVAATSATSDPTGSWARWILGGGSCPDQPRLGLSDTMVVIGANEEGSCDRTTARYVGGVVYVLNKQEMLAGGALDWQESRPSIEYGSPTPAQGLSAGATAYAATDNGGFVRVLTLSGGPPPGNIQTQQADLPAQPFIPPPDSAQPGTDTLVSTNDERLLDAFWENGKLWLSSNTACALAPGDVRSCARIIRIATVAPYRLELDTAFAENEANVFYPAIRPDALGDVVVGFAAASPSLNPSFETVTLMPGDRWTQPQIVTAGTGPEKSGRFGDYFGAARDPQDLNRIFLGGQYGSTAGWATTVAAVETGPAQLPPSVSYDSPSAVGVGETAATLAANVNAHGAGTTLDFEYGTTEAYGSATSQQSVSGSEGFQHVTVHLTGLAPGTTYHFRLHATNVGGTAYGIDQTFTTETPDTTAPVAVAHPSSGKAGTLVRLRFSASDDRGQVRVVDEVVRGSRVIGRAQTGFEAASAATSVTWRAPRKVPSGKLSHCVRASDPAGNVSTRSCAALTLR